MMLRHLAAATATLALLAAGCGDDADDAVGGPDPADLAEDPQGAVDDLADDLRDLQDAQGGGSATLTIGDQTWEFGSVLCAYGPGETGRDDTEFVLSSIEDGLQLDATINTEFGHSVSLNDIEDFENPSASWSAGGPFGALTGDPEEIIQVDGKEVTAEATFIDDTSDDLAQVPGRLVATCP
jgi:hypothetical protein